VIVWRGQHATDQSALAAEAFAQQLLSVEKLQGGVVFLSEGEGAQLPLPRLSPRFKVAFRTKTSYDDLIPSNDTPSATAVIPQGHCCSKNSGEDAESPSTTSTGTNVIKLFRLKSTLVPAAVQWEDMGVFDSDDLESHHAYLLLNPKEDEESFLWVGSESRDQETNEGIGDLHRWAAGDAVMASLQTLREGRKLLSTPLRIELEGEETEDFWALFDGSGG